MKSHYVFDGILTGFSLLSFLLIASSGIAAEKAPQSDLAIKGYDAVAYFKAGKAAKGSGSFTFPWHDMTWHFSTKENRDLFAASPELYQERRRAAGPRDIIVPLHGVVRYYSGPVHCQGPMGDHPR